MQRPTDSEKLIFERTARVSSTFSLIGASFIIITFCTSKNFHRPINRLAFYASFGNIMTNVATMYAQEGINAGPNSRLCQVQGAIIQWAIPADALFCLAMAFNVYLTVFRKKTSEQLKVLEPLYIVLCYGIPLVPSLVFYFCKPRIHGKIYGPATLWCWIGNDWQVLRIAAFYAPIWIVLATTFFIYAIAGRVIFTLRKNLRQFAKDGRHSSQLRSSSHFQGHQTTGNSDGPLVVPGKIAVTTVDTVELTKVEDLERAHPNQNGRSISITPELTRHANSPALPEITSYTCHIEAVPHRPSPRPRSMSKNNSAIEANTAAWAYCRCAMLFFLALIITWLPSSINRIYNIATPNAFHFDLNFAAVLVLPAQGFWNGLIYVVTTLPACKQWFGDIWELLQRPMIWYRQNWPRRPHKDISSAQSLSSSI
ncbi:hypothetical protein BDD12DRAFT_853591 [Trichophaea hybrida]|nr:hypothetical protein BDD12DRAFT_853591 [Trichophaea hybrida]